MKFKLVGTISYDIDDQYFNKYLKKENVTLEEYKKEATEYFKELLESEVEGSDSVRNIKVDVRFEDNKEDYQYECDLCGQEYVNQPDICRCGGINCFIKFK